jgi:hypothetical protein
MVRHHIRMFRWVCNCVRVNVELAPLYVRIKVYLIPASINLIKWEVQSRPRRWDLYSEALRLEPCLGMPPPPLYSVSFSNICIAIATQITDCYWSEESFLTLIGYYKRYTE